MKRINLAVIGKGRWGKSTYHLFNSRDIKDKIDHTYLLSSKEKISKLKDKHLDAVIICVPDNKHLKVVEEIKKHLKIIPHVLIEKPIEVSFQNSIKIVKILGYEVTDSLICLPKSHNSPFLFIDWHKKFSPQNIELINTLKKNREKLPSSIRIRFLDKRMVLSKKFIKWYKETDIFSFLGAHYFDLLLDLFPNYPPISVTANSLENEEGTIIEASIIINLGMKCMVTYNLSCNEPNNSKSLTEQDICLVFEKSKYEINTTGIDFESLTKRGVNLVNTHSRNFYKDKWTGEVIASGYTYESQKRFIESVWKIKNGTSTVFDENHKYPLTVMPEKISELCKMSLIKGIKKGNICLGKPMIFEK